MFRHFNQVTALAHQAVAQCCSTGALAIDATLGNGADTDFLLERFERVVSFDIQEAAIAAYDAKKKERVQLIAKSHHLMDHYVKEPVDCIMFNLGFLPGSNKQTITRPDTSLPAILTGLDLLRPGGLMTLAIYTGHEGGPEERDAILKALAGLPKKTYAVVLQSFHNRSDRAPILIVVEKALYLNMP